MEQEQQRTQNGYVFVKDAEGRPLMPCHPARARELLRKDRAYVKRRYPFTIQMRDRTEGELQHVWLGIDPGSKTTGIAVSVEGKRGFRCVKGINLTHRGAEISNDLESRANSRRSRRNRKTRYRQPRFLNRRKPKGWLPPSIMHRVLTTITWAQRLMRLAPVSLVEVEMVSFDTQKILNKEIKGKEYQRGTLLGYKIREYLLYRYNHTCQYCNGVSKDKVLNMEHIVPRSRGGVDSIGNLTLSCVRCNTDKNALLLHEWEKSLLGKGDALSRARRKGIHRVLKGIKPSLKDAAAVNACKYRLLKDLREIGLPVYERPSYVTKYNRHRQGYPKDHWIDAAVLGGISRNVYIPESMRQMDVKCTGHGSRQMCSMDKYGFPKTKPKGPSRVYDFKTGDIVRAVIPSGKYAGHHVGRVAVRSNGWFTINKIGIHYKHITLLQKKDGYHYTAS